MELILIRHTSVDVLPGTCYGRTDVPLRDSFPDEAEEVRRQLESFEPFDAVFTSPLSRCRLLADYCGYPKAIRDVRLMELDFGLWEMQAYDSIRDPQLAKWYADYLHVAATGGESFMDQFKRVSAFIDEVSSLPFRRIALFTHGGVQGCALIYAHRVLLEEVFCHIPPYGGILYLPIVEEVNPVQKS